MKKLLFILCIVSSLHTNFASLPVQKFDPHPPSTAPENILFTLLDERNISQFLRSCAESPSLMRERDPQGNTLLMRALEMNYHEGIDFLIKTMPKHEASIGGTTSLHWALKNNNLELVERLIANGAAVDVPDEWLKTPLHYASELAEPAFTKKLLESHADPEIQDLDGETPLHKVSRKGNAVIAKLLLSAGSNPNRKDRFGRTQLHLAALGGDPELCSLLIEHKANLAAKDPQGSTALHFSAQSGAWKCVNVFLSKGLLPEEADANGHTPLHLAVAKNDVKTVTALLILQDKNNFLNKSDNNGLTALQAAAEAESLPIIAILLANGAERDRIDSEGRTPFYVLIKKKNRAGASLFVDVEICNELRPLLQPASFGFLDKLEQLIKRGPEAINSFNETGLITLIGEEKNNKPSQQALPKVAANVNKFDTNQMTPLHHAVESGSTDVIKSLLKAGADATIESPHMISPLCLAAQKGRLDCLKLLLSASSVDVSSGKMGPLHYAALWGNPDCVRFLLEAGASIDHLGCGVDHKASPLEFAAVNFYDSFLHQSFGAYYPTIKMFNFPLDRVATDGHKECFKILMDAGASFEDLKTKGWTDLHTATVLGDLSSVQRILSSGTYIMPKPQLISPLHLAALYGNTACVACLLEHFSELVFDGGFWTATPLHSAILKNRPECLSLFLKLDNEALLKIQNYFDTPVHTAVAVKSINTLKLLLATGNWEVSTEKFWDGNSPLHIAAAKGHFDCLSMLPLQKHLETGEEELPVGVLHAAVEGDDERCINYCVSKGAHLNDVCYKYYDLTPLHLAAKLNKKISTRSLLLLGADTEAKTKIGKTALHLAARYGSVDCLKLLLNAGAQRESHDLDHRTPLFEAAEYRQVACMRALILAGAQVQVKDKYNKKPLVLGYFLDHSNLEKQADSSVSLGANIRSKKNNSNDDDDAE